MSPSIKRDLRYLVVDGYTCNFRCIFCHHEGYSRHSPPIERISPKQLRGLFEIARDNFDFCGVTITGGEPTLAGAQIVPYIEELRKSLPTNITLVTNGSLLTRELLQLLKSAGLTDLRISLHASSQDIYEKVTGQRKVKLNDAIKVGSYAISLGIPVKFNYTILRGINDAFTETRRFIDLSLSIGASVKFIELLPLDGCKSLHRSIDAVASELSDYLLSIGFSQTSRPRGIKFVKDEHGPSIEFVACNCRFDCYSCSRYFDLSLAPDGSIVPCFLENSVIKIDWKNQYDSLKTALDYRLKMEDVRRKILEGGS